MKLTYRIITDLVTGLGILGLLAWWLGSFDSRDYAHYVSWNRFGYASLGLVLLGLGLVWRGTKRGPK